jgi:hypothetical protein
MHKLFDRYLEAIEYNPYDSLSVEVFKAFLRFLTPPLLVIDIFFCPGH